MLDAARYEELIDMAIAANFNILRSWGGGIVNKDSFFEYCDRRGILVWQEFPLACNCYPDDPHYLAVLEQEATSIIRRLRRHPSLAIWCGGNELFNNWSGMTDQSLPLRLLNALCYRLSPEIPFNATSPLNGMAHGNYLFYWNGRDIFQSINNSHFTAYTEFGIPGISPREVLEKVIPPEELFPPRPGTAWEEHHAFGAWDGQPETWLEKPAVERYFGKQATLDELIAHSSLLQGEGYKAIFEEARRQKPYCGMALNWCFGEPWPSAANNSLVVYPVRTQTRVRRGAPRLPAALRQRALRPLRLDGRRAVRGRHLDTQRPLRRLRAFRPHGNAPGCRTDARTSALGKPRHRPEPEHRGSHGTHAAPGLGHRPVPSRNRRRRTSRNGRPLHARLPPRRTQRGRHGPDEHNRMKR